MHDDTCGRCIPSLEGVLVGYHAALTDWRCFFRERYDVERKQATWCASLCSKCCSGSDTFYTAPDTTSLFAQLGSRMESIRQCIVRQSIPRSSQMQLELTVTQKICSYSPQTFQNLHNVFTDLLKCDDRSCVLVHELGIGIYIRPRYRVNATETSGILLGHSLHA